MDKMDGLSLNLKKQNIQRIKELFPEAVEEGKINFDMLRAMLGDEVDDSREKYQFTWNGKAKSIKLAQTPSSATLRPCKEKSKNWDETENLYIEGDNLEVLKQLQKTYYGKIKMIYIDPPYNTGNDFVYNDSFSNTIENYKEQTNQVSSSNPESNGRFHTDWLNMMYPRLILAKNLMSEDGVIFISIDDNEQENLKKICNEILGVGNFEGHIHWRRRHNQPNDKNKMIGLVAEHILVYAKNSTHLKSVGVGKLDVTASFTNPDNDPNGPWASKPWKVGSDQSGSHYTITTPSGKTIEGEWMGDENTYYCFLNEGRIYFPKNGDGMPRKKYYQFEREEEGQCATNWWPHDQFGHNQGANNCMTELFGIKNIFSNPKPVELIRAMLKVGNVKDDDIILDFFSGSASTAHAVMKLNNEDGRNRKFIMVQLPELCSEKSEAYKTGYKNICEIGEERIRRAGEQIKAEWEKEHPSDGLFGSEEQFTADIGFKVFKLDSTNVNEWDPNMKLDEKELAMRLSEVFKEGRSKEDILYEIMLKYGVFDKQVEEINVNGKTMYRVGKRYMIVCLEDSITSEDVKSIGELSPKTVIFNEAGFDNDNDKINAVYNLEKYGVEDVKCI